MSHFTEIQTKMTELKILREVFESLKLDFEINEGSAMVKGFYGDEICADIKISTGTPYDIGLRKTSQDAYEFVGDWDMLKAHKFDQEDFCNKVQQKYSYIQVKQNLSAQGFELEDESVDENGNIQLKVSQW